MKTCFSSSACPSSCPCSLPGTGRGWVVRPRRPPFRGLSVLWERCRAATDRTGLVARPSSAGTALPLPALGQQPPSLQAEEGHMEFPNTSIFGEIQFKIDKVKML